MTGKTLFLSFKLKETDEGDWKATEPGTDSDNWGRGPTQAAAVAHYAELMDQRGDDNE